MNIGCVLMAAGTASRFGENKLLYELEGKSLLARALTAAPARLFARAVAVVSDPIVAQIVTDAGYTAILNPNPVRGQGATIALGTRAMVGMDASLFCVADQPYLRVESVARLLAAYEPDMFYALAHESKRGNPVLFPADSFAALCTLQPEQTGRAVLSQHLNRLRLIEVEDARELMDVDTHQDLARLDDRGDGSGPIR